MQPSELLNVFNAASELPQSFGIEEEVVGELVDKINFLVIGEGGRACDLACRWERHCGSISVDLMAGDCSCGRYGRSLVRLGGGGREV